MLRVPVLQLRSMPPRVSRKSATPKEVCVHSALASKRVKRLNRVKKSGETKTEAIDTQGTKLLRLLAMNASPRTLSIGSSPPQSDDEAWAWAKTDDGHYKNRSCPYRGLPPLQSEKEHGHKMFEGFFH